MNLKPKTEGVFAREACNGVPYVKYYTQIFVDKNV